ncbi:MAG: glycosyltransferase family A protein [Planctomycetota bacterium]|nr:glycosyltransferase family A protein [Planctomycetota bacterium]
MMGSTPNSELPAATVVITTKNRKDELRTALASVVRQTVAVEILVFDDGSTDGTSEMVAAEFPQARLHRVEQSLGIIEARNAAIPLATAPIAITIDDDCVFPTEDIVKQTLADFDHPRVGVVAIPSIDVRKSQETIGLAPDREGVYICSQFRGGANAIRKDLFVKLEGYRGFLWRQGEEADFCIRMLDAGYVVRVGLAEPIHHYESLARDRTKIMYYTSRNNVLYAWYNVPMPYFPAHLAATTWNCLRAGMRYGYVTAAVKGIVCGYGAMAHERGRRAALSTRSYQLTRRLRGRGIMKLEEIEGELGEMREDK